MGMFSRFTDIINANLNNMLDKAEDPKKMIKLIIQEMEETLIEVRSTAAKQIAEKKSVSRHINQVEQQVNSWQEKAELAIAKSRDDLAKAALKQKHQLSLKVNALRDELTQLEEILARVQQDAQQLQVKITDAKRKQEALLLREQSAQVRVKLRERAQIYNIEQAIAKFECYQQKVEAIEAEVEAYELTESKSLDDQFRELVVEDNIEQELTALKKKAVNS